MKKKPAELTAEAIQELEVLEVIDSFVCHGGLFRSHPREAAIRSIAMRLWEKGELVVLEEPRRGLGISWGERATIPSNRGYWHHSGRGGERLRGARRELMEALRSTRARLGKALETATVEWERWMNRADAGQPAGSEPVSSLEDRMMLEVCREPLAGLEKA
jgi:hypothetical protein